VPELTHLRDAALEIFRAALQSVDARRAVKRAVHLDGSLLYVKDTAINLAPHAHAIHAIAIGKAAHAMASALEEILGEKLTAGVVAGLPLEQSNEESTHASLAAASSSLSDRWRVFACGHPLPNEESLAAARAAFETLDRAEETRALVIFLVSGGGSALIERPRDEQVTLAELQTANRVLVNCGASIAEINAVRRAISAVKGGGLAARAPHAAQLTLIISDTNKGEETTVASGPTLYPQSDAPDAASVIERYELSSHLPASILRSISQPTLKTGPPTDSLRRHYVLLSNEDATTVAARAAAERGLDVEVADDIVEQEIGDGCAQLLERLLIAHQRVACTGRIVCLISGGEFACPVRGGGIGGRNSETALRLALEIEARRIREQSFANFSSHIVALSAGTDGVDGNSPAAGAFSDETTLHRAQMMNLDARRFLERSDAFTFFEALGDLVMTGPTGTNVRDIRILLAG
jgi:hydroxypyruvate reductase